MAGTGRYFFDTHTGRRRYPTKAAAVAAGKKYVNSTGVGVVINVEDDDVRVPRSLGVGGRTNPAQRRKRKRTLKASGYAPVNAGMIRKAIGIIYDAEQDLGRLSAGQRRDLLKDNTNWDSDQVTSIVKSIPSGPTNPWRSNPAIFGGSVARHRHRALGSGYTVMEAWTTIKKSIKALKTKTKPLAKRARKVTREVANELPGGKHYVTLKVGPKEVTEVFDTKSHAQAFAKAARKQGFADAIIY